MRLIATALILFAFVLAGCGDDGSPTTTDRSTDSTPAGTTPGVGDTRDCPDSKKQPTFDVTVLFGLDRVKAAEVSEENGYEMRAIFVDGEPKAATMDYNPKRLNVAIREGVVTQLCSVG